MLLYPTNLAISSIRSASIFKSNLQDGTFTFRLLLLDTEFLNPRLESPFLTEDLVKFVPRILLRLLMLRMMSLFLGIDDFLINSCIGEKSLLWVSFINVLALCIAKTCNSKSTPRSNLVEASV